MFAHLPIPKPIAVSLEAMPHKVWTDYDMPPDHAIAAIALEPSGRHTLVIGERFWALRPDQQAFVLTHEFTHLAYGHPLQCLRLKLDPQRWNVATDAWINEPHPPEMIQELGAISYSMLREQVVGLPPWLIDPLNIYRHLEAQGVGGQTFDVIMVDDLDEQATGQANLEVLKARQAIRAAAQHHPEYKRILDEIAVGCGPSTGVRSDVKTAVWLEGIYRQLDRLASMRRGDLVRRRGWRRPGRFPNIPGCSRRPSLNVMIALDVSGSTATWWDDILAATNGIMRYHEVTIVCHNDKIVYDGRVFPAEAPVGGGTAFTPVVELAKQRDPDCVIWVTDGESGDKPTLPPCPIHWVWLPGSRQWSLRAQDSMSQYQEAT